MGQCWIGHRGWRPRLGRDPDVAWDDTADTVTCGTGRDVVIAARRTPSPRTARSRSRSACSLLPGWYLHDLAQAPAGLPQSGGAFIEMQPLGPQHLSVVYTCKAGEVGAGPRPAQPSIASGRISPISKVGDRAPCLPRRSPCERRRRPRQVLDSARAGPGRSAGAAGPAGRGGVVRVVGDRRGLGRVCRDPLVIAAKVRDRLGRANRRRAKGL